MKEQNKNQKANTNDRKAYKEGYTVLNPEQKDRYDEGQTNSVPGINTPEISPLPFNPPVPNRAWTAMKDEH